MFCPGKEYSYLGSLHYLEYWKSHADFQESDWESQPDEHFGVLDSTSPTIVIEPATEKIHLRAKWRLTVLDRKMQELNLTKLMRSLDSTEERRALVMRAAPPHPNMKCILKVTQDGRSKDIEYETFQMYVGGHVWLPVVPEDPEELQRMRESIQERQNDPFAYEDQ